MRWYDRWKAPPLDVMDWLVEGTRLIKIHLSFEYQFRSKYPTNYRAAFRHVFSNSPVSHFRASKTVPYSRNNYERFARFNSEGYFNERILCFSFPP